MDLSTAYQTLGIAPTATWREARAAWRRLAAKHHPDRGGDQARFILSRQAWEVVDSVTTGVGSPPPSASPSSPPPTVQFGTSFVVREMRINGLRNGTAARACLTWMDFGGTYETLLHVDLLAPTPINGGLFEATLHLNGALASIRGPIVSTSGMKAQRGQPRGTVAFWVRPTLGPR